MNRAWVAICVIAGAAIVGGVLGLYRPSTAPAAPDHRAQISQAQRAFCNCIGVGGLDQCLASAETGRGIGVSDQELLLSACLDHR